MTETRTEYIVSHRRGEPLPWRCPNDHLLGYVTRKNHIRRLWVDITCVGEEGELRQMTVVLIGSGDVSCPVCGEMRTWHAGEEAMEDLIRRMRG
jgi:hypothetical protein